MTAEFHRGDRVLFPYKEPGDVFFTKPWTGVVTETCGKLVHVEFRNEYGSVHDEWFKVKRVKLIERTGREEPPQRPALVDARVLEELTAIQRHLGSSEALLDLLRDIRKSYETGTKANDG